MATNPPHNPDIELIFLGTGTSGSLPNVSCLTAPEDGDKPPCHTCLSTLRPEGKKNIRRNTSAVMRIDGKDGRKRTIVIDVGKNFHAAAIEWFPKYGLRHIDAVLITHAHADAMNGLDDLRGWTLRGAIQRYIDVYASQATYDEVERAFPYMVSKKFASGGGDVPEFKWHIYDDKVPFEIEGSGIEFTPLIVEHGQYFSSEPVPASSPTPVGLMTPIPSGANTPNLAPPAPQISSLILPPAAPVKKEPYMCFGFKIQESIVYLSDVSRIPESSWEVLERPIVDGKPAPPFGAVILDCLRPVAHISHFGIGEAADHARKIGGTRTYLIGFGHEISHEEYVRIGEVVGGKELDEESLSPGERKCIDILKEHPGKDVWLRPSHDGLRLLVRPDGTVEDSTYDT